METEGWVTLVVVLVAIVIMVRDIVAPVIAILGATLLLYVIGVIDAGEAFSGFSNPAPLTIAVLYVLAAAASRSGAFQPLVRRTLSATASDRAQPRPAPSTRVPVVVDSQQHSDRRRAGARDPGLGPAPRA